MELTFVESNALGKVKAWECEFEVTADFNLHIEREKGGRILFYQKSQGAGGWAHIDDMGWQDGKPSIDYDFTALVYPKMIKIVSESEPTFASVATDGEVTEIKSQSKEIEVTANGTTMVEPDAGFAYLNKVSVKTNVEQSGGGASGDEWWYLDYKQAPASLVKTILLSAGVVKLRGAIGPKELLVSLIGITDADVVLETEYVAINLSQPVFISEDGITVNSLQEVLSLMPDNSGYANMWECLNSIPRITKEEFYAL